MITIEHGVYRFYEGDNITYTDARTSWLLEVATTSADADRRNYAAAGLMRAVLDTPVYERDLATFHPAMNWASRVIQDVQAGSEPPEPDASVVDFFRTRPHVNGVFDSTSMAATRANKPEVTAAIIGEYVPETDSKLVIALGHGGILSALSTYSVLPGDNVFYALRFSKYRAKDRQPVLSTDEIRHLQGVAEDSAVVIYDEDRGLMGEGTIGTAVRFINQVLNVRAIGITPVLSRHPSSMWPEILVPGTDGGSYVTESFSNWSDKYKKLVQEVERIKASPAANT